MHERCIKATILGCGWYLAIPANQNDKYECVYWASKYSILLAGSVCMYIYIYILGITSLADTHENTHWNNYRAASRFAPSQWETSLQSNAVSNWLSAHLESTLNYFVPPLLSYPRGFLSNFVSYISLSTLLNLFSFYCIVLYASLEIPNTIPLILGDSIQAYPRGLSYVKYSKFDNSLISSFPASSYPMYGSVAWTSPTLQYIPRNMHTVLLCQWSKPDGYGKISQCITTTKHSKAKTVCIFLGIYCILCEICSLMYPIWGIMVL